MLRPAAVLAVLILLSVPAASMAQDASSGTIAGVVRDEGGAVLPGVTVKLVHQGTSATFTKLTDETGEFTFTFLAAGNYTVTLELPTTNDSNVFRGLSPGTVAPGRAST